MKFRSKFEKEVYEKLFKGTDYEYEPLSIPYVMSHKYNPDFVKKSHPKILIEIKGRFEDNREARKYVEFRKCNPEYVILFIFQKPENRMPSAQKRKDGTYYTMREWAEKQGFHWYTVDTFPRRFLK